MFIALVTIRDKIPQHLQAIQEMIILSQLEALHENFQA
jgi:hypothetical protein